MDRCSVCHHAFSQDDLTVVRREEEYWVVAVTCADCHSRNLVAAVLTETGADEARSVLREMSREADAEIRFEDDEPDAEVVDAGPAVSAEDVLDMHEFLRAFDGDFKRLFRAAR